MKKIAGPMPMAMPIVKSCTPLVIAGRQVVCKRIDEGKQLSK